MSIIITEDIPSIEKLVAMNRIYVFDFSRFPELQAGLELNTPTVPAVSGLTIGTPSITTEETEGVPAEKGVAVRISGGTAGTNYPVEVRCTLDGTDDVLVRRCTFVVK